MNIGQRIKERRIELGISADKLGSILGKNRSTIYRYENGDIESMPLDILKPIADALHTTPAWILGWDEEQIDEIYNVQMEANEFDENKEPLKLILEDIWNMNLNYEELSEVLEFAKYIKSKRK